MRLRGYNNNSLMDDAKNKNPEVYNLGTKNNSNSNIQLQPYDISSYGSGGSGYNISSILSAYDQSAAADREMAKFNYDTTIQNIEKNMERARNTYNTGVADANRSYETTANRLEKALKRFQASNAKDVANQKRSYLADQAALEDARFQADRQTRIDAAARGLGGSGLQQLAQLQNLISQGNDISELAISNQGVMDNLREALSNYTEDYNDDLSDAQTLRDTTLSNLLTTLGYAESDYATDKTNALTNYTNIINKINADLASNKAGAYSSYSSGGSSDSDYADTIAGIYGSLEQKFENELKSIYSGKGSPKDKNKDAQKLYNSYLNQSADVYGSYGNKYKGLQNTNLNNLSAILNKYSK